MATATVHYSKETGTAGFSRAAEEQQSAHPLAVAALRSKITAPVGVFGNLGAIIELNSSQSNPGSVKLINNPFGLLGQNGTHFSINGPVLIQANAQDGIRLRGSSGEPNPSDGTAGPTIQGGSKVSILT